MKTKRTPVALLVVVAITAVVYPVRISAQGARTSPVAPRRELVAAVVQEAYDKFKSESKGKNADYIPYLAQVDSEAIRNCNRHYRQPGHYQGRRDLFLLHPIDLQSLSRRRLPWKPLGRTWSLTKSARSPPDVPLTLL